MTTPDISESNNAEKKERGAKFYIMLVLGGSVGLCLLLFLIALGVGMMSGKWENIAHFIAIIRDLFLILLVLQGIIVGVALMILVLQVSALTNILKNELRPIVDSTQQAADTAKGTALFVGKHAVGPLMQTKSAMTGTLVFVREILAIQRAVQPREEGDDGETETTPTDPFTMAGVDLGDSDGDSDNFMEGSSEWG